MVFAGNKPGIHFINGINNILYPDKNLDRFRNSDFHRTAVFKCTPWLPNQPEKGNHDQQSLVWVLMELRAPLIFLFFLGELLKQGYSVKVINKIWGGNFLRVFNKVEETTAGIVK